MGGEREDVIETRPKGRKSPEATELKTAGQSIRIHESNGEVHFHVDKEKLKCAVPVGEWWKAWNVIAASMRKGMELFYFVDEVNGTALIVTDVITTDAKVKGGPYTRDTTIEVRKLENGNDVFKKLKKFTEAK